MKKLLNDNWNYIILFTIILILFIIYYSNSENYLNLNLNSIPHENIPIKIIDNFISESECDQLINLASNRFEKSRVFVENNDRIIDIDSRTSSNTYFIRGENEIIRSIEKKISAMLNIRIEQIEPIQIVRYTKGQQYKYHHDYFKYQYK